LADRKGTYGCFNKEPLDFDFSSPEKWLSEIDLSEAEGVYNIRVEK
jgi:hypothetical protein